MGRASGKRRSASVLLRHLRRFEKSRSGCLQCRLRVEHRPQIYTSRLVSPKCESHNYSPKLTWGGREDERGRHPRRKLAA
jgi:hypothetical protein